MNSRLLCLPLCGIASELIKPFSLTFWWGGSIPANLIFYFNAGIKVKIPNFFLCQQKSSHLSNNLIIYKFTLLHLTPLPADANHMEWVSTVNKTHKVTLVFSILFIMAPPRSPVGLHKNEEDFPNILGREPIRMQKDITRTVEEKMRDR
jgi:hypothetical protein